MHFGIGSITLLKIVSRNEMTLLPAIGYFLFALAFAFVFMKNPIKSPK